MLLPLLFLVISTHAAPKRPVVLWGDTTHTHPYFVEAASIDLLPSAARHEVERALASAKKQKEDFDATSRANGVPVARCAPGIIGDSLLSQTPSDVIRGAPAVAVGKIVDVVSGWNIERHAVTSLLFIRVDDVWKGSGIGVRDVVIMEMAFGTLQRGDDKFCSEMRGSGHFQSGRSILILGDFNPKRSPLQLLGGAWPVENGQVLPPHAAPLPLEDLRNSIR